MTDLLQHIAGPDSASMLLRKTEHGQPFWNGSFEPVGQARSTVGILQDNLSQLDLGLFTVWRIENRSNVCCNRFAHLLAQHILASVLLQMKLAPLPGNAGKHRLAGVAQSAVIITDDQLHTTQAAFDQALKELPPVQL